MFPRLQRLLLKDPGAISHPDPQAATRFGFQVLFFSLREFVLWEPLREAARQSQDRTLGRTPGRTPGRPLAPRRRPGWQLNPHVFSLRISA